MLIDLSIVAVFIAYSVGAGFFYRRKASKNLEEYFLAGRTLRGWQAGFSMAATQYAADTPLLVTGLVAVAGVFSLWRLWIYAIAFLLMGFLLGGPWRRAGVLTDAELTELRYGGRAAVCLRALKAIHLGTFVNCTVLAMVLIAAARIAEPFLPWHQWLPPPLLEPAAHFMERMGFLLTTLPEGHPAAWIVSADNLVSLTLIVAFVWLYSATGGLRSVVATDVVQFSIAMLATFLYAWIVVDRAGGLGSMAHRLTGLYGPSVSQALLSFGPVRWDEASLLFCGVLAVQWFAQVNADGTGYLAQRTMACQSASDARTAAVTFSFAQILVRSLLWLSIAVGLLVLYPVEQFPALGTASESFRIGRESSFAWGMRDLLPAGIRGLMLTGMLAALASTVDTHLNWGASYWTNDLYKRLLMEGWLGRAPRDRELVWVARFSTAGILGIAFLIGIHLKSIQTTWHLSLLFGSGMGAVLILRWVWYRINVYSEISAGMASLLLSPILLFGFPELSEAARLLWMVALSTAVVIGVTFLTRPESEETLKRFYSRARPCGNWKPVARQLGEDPAFPTRKLWRAAAATALATATLFCLLVGAGQMVVQAPQELQRLRSIALIGIGLALIPLWARLGFRSRE